MRISKTAIRKWCTYELPETKAASTGPVLVFLSNGDPVMRTGRLPAH